MSDESTNESAKPSTKDEPLPAHLADPEYVGPLTGDQALARIAKFRKPDSKPAAVPQTKAAK